MKGSWTVESLSKLAELITQKLFNFSRCLHVDGEIRREVLGRVLRIAPLHSTGEYNPRKFLDALQNNVSSWKYILKTKFTWYFFVYAG